mgnify:CR=1 FL=1
MAHAYSRLAELDAEVVLTQDLCAVCAVDVSEVDDALAACDHVVRVRQVVRETAFDLGHCATFMAKPHAKEPGSAMHLHQSVVDAKTRQNIFSNPDGSPSNLFFAHIAGLQRYLPAAMSLFAPCATRSLTI